MEQTSLATLLDGERDMVMTLIARDRSLPAAQIAMEKAIDRVMYRYVELSEDERLRYAAQVILQSMKNTLPMMDTVGEAREWKKQADIALPKKRGIRSSALGFMSAGVVLVLATVLGVLIMGRTVAPMSFVKVLAPVALGCGSLFWGGSLASKPPKQLPAPADESPVRTEYLVDEEKAWHCLRGAMLLADGQLETLRQENAARQERELRQDSSPARGTGKVSGDELDLFAELLETAYAEGGESAQESITAIRFFLHNAKIDVTDYAPGQESWFEFLPAAKPGTIRPALTAEGKLLKKGMAAK